MLIKMSGDWEQVSASMLIAHALALSKTSDQSKFGTAGVGKLSIQDAEQKEEIQCPISSGKIIFFQCCLG